VSGLGAKVVAGAVGAALVVGVGVAIAAQIKPSSFGQTKRFSVAQAGSSGLGTGTVCADLTVLPPGPVLIESLDVQSFANLEASMQVEARSLTGSGYSGVARIGLQMQQYPIAGGNWHGHLSTAVVIREGDVDKAPAGALNRDATHPVQLCVRDVVDGVGYSAYWTISGQVGK
jgi:hypothetical protein